MKNIFKRLIATMLVCVLFIGGISSVAWAEGGSEVVEPSSPEPAPVQEPAPQPEPGPQPEPDPVPEPDQEAQPEPKTETNPQPILQPEPETISEPEPEPQPELVPAPVPQPEPDVGNNTQDEDGNNLPTDPDGGTENGPEAGESSDSTLPDTPNADNSPEGTDDNLPVEPDGGEDFDQDSDVPSDLPSSGDVPADSDATDENAGEVKAATIVSFETSSLPKGKNVAYGTIEAELDLPTALTAVWSDGMSNDVGVYWQCIDDDNGGTAYIPEHENPAAVYTFQAVLVNGENCSAEMPVIYIAYEAVAVALSFEPLLWTDVMVKIDEAEYAINYGSVVFNAQADYALGLSVTEEEWQEPNPEIKPEIEASEEGYNLVAFRGLASDTEYSVWAKIVDDETWSLLDNTVTTEAVKIALTKQGEAITADTGLFLGDELSAETNLVEPEYRWLRADQDEAVSEDATYILSYADVGTGLYAVVHENAYSAESAEILVLPPAPSELKLNTLAETLTVLFAEDIPAGASLELMDSESAVIETLEIGETGQEFSFAENMRAYAGKQLKVCLRYNGVAGIAKEIAIAVIPSAPEAPAADELKFAAASQQSIDFSCGDLSGLEFAYKATDSEDVLTVISDNPETITGLSANTGYTLYFRSAATEVDFASDWTNTGLSVTTGLLDLTVPQESIYYDSVIAVSPADSYSFAEGYPVYRWYCSSAAEFNENAKLLEAVTGAELNLPAQGFTKGDIGKRIFVSLEDGYGNTSAMKALPLCRYEDPLLTLDRGERIMVGETVTAFYNGTETEYTWQWFRDELPLEGANTESYIANVQDANTVLTVKVLKGEEELASAYVAVDMCAPTVVVDYEKESISVSVNGAMSEGWTLRICDENGVFIDKPWPKDASSATYSLAELGIDPDAHKASSPDYMVSLSLLNVSGDGKELQLTLPTRRDYSGAQLDMNTIGRPGAAELSFAVPAGLNLALSADGGSGPDFGLGSGPSFSLQENTSYKVWLRDAAVAGVSFAGEWADMGSIATGVRKEVSVSLKDTNITWRPGLEIPGLSISDNGVGRGDLNRSWYDENGKALNGEPSNAGKYTLKLSLNSEASKWHKLKENKLTLTIEPMTMSAKNTRVTCEQLTYNGKEQMPQRMKIIVDGLEIPSSEFATEKTSGYDCISAGSHIIKVVGKGNVSGGIKILYVISTAKPAAIAWPTAGYLVTGQKLSESRLTGGSTNAGSFAWENGNTVPSTGVSKHNVVFTPADTKNYDWTGVTLVKPVEVKVYSIAPPVDGSDGADTGYHYDYSATTGYWGEEVEESDTANVSEQLAEAYLSAGTGSSDTDMLEIVYDVAGQPMDYELLLVLHEDEELNEPADHTFMITTQPDMDGEFASRSLRMSLAQLDYIWTKHGFSNLLFRNGGAEAFLRNEEVLTAKVAKLAAYMLTTDEEAIDLMDLDFDLMEEPVLNQNELAGLWLDVRIDPVILTEENESGVIEKEAWDVSLWLCTESMEVEISTLVPGFTIGLNVNGFFDEIEQEELIVGNGMALVDENGGKLLLTSELKQLPGVLPESQEDVAELYAVAMPLEAEEGIWTDYTPDMDLSFYRNDVLATLYAGSGAYMLMDQAEGF